MQGTDMPMFLDEAIRASIDCLKSAGRMVDTGHWQGIPTGGNPSLVTREIMNLNFTCQIPETAEQTEILTRANVPWAEAHFQERVSRTPDNPGSAYREWPWWRGQEKETAADPDKPFQFTHTYMERFWPKRANRNYADPWRPLNPARGIRYEYGDLDDVVNLLRQHPFTRQATFPIFFPEDTGAVHGGRIPCTLHYHFLLREDKLHMWYPIRACDAVRHFRDDLYMACRLNQWVLEELRNGDNDYKEQALWEDTVPGALCFTAYSFHVHQGDYHRL